MKYGNILLCFFFFCSIFSLCGCCRGRLPVVLPGSSANSMMRLLYCFLSSVRGRATGNSFSAGRGQWYRFRGLVPRGFRFLVFSDPHTAGERLICGSLTSIWPDLRRVFCSAEISSVSKKLWRILPTLPFPCFAILGSRLLIPLHDLFYFSFLSPLY